MLVPPAQMLSDRAEFARGRAASRDLPLTLSAAQPISDGLMQQTFGQLVSAPRRRIPATPRGGTGPYEPFIRELRRQYDVRIKKWRRSMSGCAWRVYKSDGSTVNWVESPYPKTPISLAIFLHEIGHHAIGFDRYK